MSLPYWFQIPQYNHNIPFGQIGYTHKVLREEQTHAATGIHLQPC